MNPPPTSLPTTFLNIELCMFCICICFFPIKFFFLILKYLILTCVPKHEPPSHLPPHNISLGHPSAPSLNALSHASNLDWRSISHVAIYMFQGYSLKSSHPLPFPQRPKLCSIHLCLFCCLAYRVIVTIFLNSIYMC